MSGYKTFAVAGAGSIGAYITEELLNLQGAGVISSVVVLSRCPRKLARLATLGAKLIEVDYTRPQTLLSALTSIDVVISTLGGGVSGLASQSLLASAARHSRAKLFVPSEFGNPPTRRNPSDPFFAVKDSIRETLSELALPYAVFYTGPFPDSIFVPPFGFDLTNGTAVVGGSGNVPISFTSQRDVARFVARILTSLPRRKIEWRTFRIEGDRQTLNSILENYQAKAGKRLNTIHVPRSELRAAVEKNPMDMPSALLLDWDLGGGVTGKPEELANEEFPDWRPKSVLDVLLA